MVTREDFYNALRKLGVAEGDSLLTHSSFKSLGCVENGAEDIVGAMFDAVGEEGTVVFPTLCQLDWEHIYENWHPDAKSDVGYLTNYFRKLPGAYRSNQATHSVAAKGKYGKYITETHGVSGKRYGIFGETPFSADSPWEKMYEMNTKILFLGVGIRKCTFRHYVEYCFMEKNMKRVEKSAKYDLVKSKVQSYGRKGVWAQVLSDYVKTVLDERGQVKYGKCGDADLILVNAKDFVDCTMQLLDKRSLDVLANSDIWKKEDTVLWLELIDKIVEEGI
jgi:aminoglycoside 3-N-acetyltransferase